MVGQSPIPTFYFVSKISSLSRIIIFSCLFLTISYCDVDLRWCLCYSIMMFVKNSVIVLIFCCFLCLSMVFYLRINDVGSLNVVVSWIESCWTLVFEPVHIANFFVVDFTSQLHTIIMVYLTIFRPIHLSPNLSLTPMDLYA